MASTNMQQAWSAWAGAPIGAPSPAPEAVKDLPLADHLLLSGVRLSVAVLQERAARPAILEAHYTHHGVGAAANGVFNLLRIIGGIGQRPVTIACVYCTTLTPDELSLLNAMSALQRGDLAKAALCFADWLPIEGVHMAIPPAQSAVRNFAICGLFLTPAFAVPS